MQDLDKVVKSICWVSKCKYAGLLINNSPSCLSVSRCKGCVKIGIISSYLERTREFLLQNTHKFPFYLTAVDSSFKLFYWRYI